MQISMLRASRSKRLRLSKAKHPANPCARNCQQCQSNRIPVRLKLRSAVPGCNRAREAHDKANQSPHKRMFHRTVRSQPRRKIACPHAVHRSIRGSQCQQAVGHALIPWREKVNRMQHEICCKGHGDARYYSHQHCQNTSTDSSRLPNIVHRLPYPFFSLDNRH